MPRRIPFHRTARPSAVPTAGAYEHRRDRLDDKLFYASRRWRHFRAWFLATWPLCADCLTRGRTVAASIVHHIRPRKDFPELAFEEHNCEALCAPCHAAKEPR